VRVSLKTANTSANQSAILLTLQEDICMYIPFSLPWYAKQKSYMCCLGAFVFTACHICHKQSKEVSYFPTFAY